VQILVVVTRNDLCFRMRVSHVMGVNRQCIRRLLDNEGFFPCKATWSVTDGLLLWRKIA